MTRSRRSRLYGGVVTCAVAATVALPAVAFPAVAATSSQARATLTQSASPAPVVASVVDLGAATVNPDVVGRDGNESTLFNGASVWGFSDTPLSVPNDRGKNWDDNTMAWTTDLDGADGLDLDHDLADSRGVPLEFLPHTPAEAAFNAQHAGTGTGCQKQPCGLEESLWNGPLVSDPEHNRMLSFYSSLVRPVGGGWRTLGAGIATISADFTVARPVARPGATYPTLLFQGGKWSPNAAIVVGQELYTYLCTAGFLVENCMLARAPLSGATLRSSWTFRTAAGTWSSSLADGAIVANGGAAGSDVTWDPGLGEYLLTYMPPLSNDVVAQVSPNLWGPWSAPTRLFTGVAPPSGAVDYAGWVHPEFAADNGLTQYVAYYHPISGLQAETRWVKVTFAPRGG